MNINNPKVTDTKPWFKQFWPWFVILFPSTAVVAGIATVVIAFKTDDGLVDNDYYKKGLMINVSTQLDKQAEALELSGYVRIDQSIGEIYLLVNNVQLTDDSILDVRLKHATRAHLDQQISVKAISAKEFRGKAVSMAPGKYNVEVILADQWRLSGEILYPKRLDTQLAPKT